MPEMMVLYCDEKPFFVDNNTTRPDKTEGGIEKRKINEIVASDRKWNFVLDAYAGFGISTAIFAKHAKKVVAVEKNLQYAAAMWANLAPSFLFNETIELKIVNEDNLEYFDKALEEKLAPPDLIDLDPFNSCKEQLKKALKWMKNGALLLTNGYIKSLSRDLDWVHNGKFFPDFGNRYTGDNAMDWPTEYFIPEELEKPYKENELKVVHYYVHPTSVRVVCTVGEFQFEPETVKKLDRDNYLDQFKDKKKR